MLVIVNEFDPKITAIYGCHKLEDCHKWMQENCKRGKDMFGRNIWLINYNGVETEAVMTHMRYRRSMKFPFDIENE